MNNQRTDTVEAYEEISTAIMAIVRSYPALSEVVDVTFSVMSDYGGISIVPTPSAIVEQERKSILGECWQQCAYGFDVYYRTSATGSEARKIDAKEWLDALGQWLEREAEYPTLSAGRKVVEIVRTAPAYQLGTGEKGSEIWAMSLKLRYTNLFMIRRS